jgi:uncharacterized membrane protein YeaQ/YmgE (transglycosylase-associated protein family)
MDITMWLVVGALVGWLGFALTGLNEKRAVVAGAFLAAGDFIQERWGV